MYDHNVIRLIKMMSKMEVCQSICWQEDVFGNLVPAIFCSDIFFWGCSDAEVVTDDDIGALEKAITDCNKDSSDGPLLFVARKRRLRPQGAAYHNIIDAANYPLFDAAGPHRDVEIGNPQGHPLDDPPAQEEPNQDEAIHGTPEEVADDPVETSIPSDDPAETTSSMSPTSSVSSTSSMSSTSYVYKQ